MSRANSPAAPQGNNENQQVADNFEGPMRRPRDENVPPPPPPAAAAAAQPPQIRQRTEGGPNWTMDSKVRDVLLDDYAGLRDMTVNDFIQKFVGGTFAVAEAENVRMPIFVKNPRKYIVDAEILEDIQGTNEFKTVKTAIDLSEKVDYLDEKEIYYLSQWEEKGTVEIREFVGPVARGRLDGAVTAAKRAEKRAHQTADGSELKGVYDSIYNATWGYVESGYDEEPLGMKVFNGRPPHMWTKEEVDVSHTPETMNEPLPRHGNLEIAVLTSQMGWPYTSFEKNPNDYDINHEKGVEYVFKSDVYIRREALRVWYKVENVLNRWLMDEVIVDDASNVLIGTPGIGKSFSVGSLLLYKLLHYEASQLQIIIYVVRGKAYVFHKPIGGRAGYVTFYNDYGNAFTVVEQIIGGSRSGEDIKGYVIFDVDKDHPAPTKPPAGCAGIALSSPNVKQFHEWSKQNTASDIYMNCDTLKDLEAIHISRWGKIAPAYKWSPPVAKEKIESEWQEIQARIRIVGPLLRHIGRLSSYNRQEGKVQEAIGKMKDDDMNDYAKYFQNAAMWQTDEVSHKLVGVVRVKEEKLLCEMYRCRPLSSYTGQAILDFLIPWLTDKYAAMSALLSNRAIAAYMFEKSGIEALSHENTLTELARELQGLSFARNQIPQSVLQVLQEPRLIGPSIVVPEDVPIVAGAEIQYMKLYKPQSRSFPVVDAFFFVESPKTFVGLQYTVSGRHPCSTGGLFKMKRYLRSYFQGWDNFSNDMVWEIIYVQRVDSEKITKPQCCERTDRDEGQNNEVEERFWKREVRQFAVSLYKHIIALYVELKTRGENNNGVNNRGGNNA
ncbi:retrotransposon hot spot (RHS) protein, putative; retrotransposon hot spot protein 1 (RHS1), putative [Trypanosoma brucei brucei TREU927]|uniref:Retrotransposon hot spot (RHS) protein, putative retrotransposon hot spot protein 1 (RHS1), putative n=1 Tax=Trypanosoma brucei brucei (strain 927/4 GUTat10.1) TaxID=185431 RepID=Q8IFI0_TRYB2|nr:retrotransposon hot spot (RHS) protein; retrotransposon hot spot protein 1 (RHS1) [Trypanosoma brucei brucei TREU927]CAD53027.1 retrotransposon hot spot (RHS) protein, putative; retrotransposon hot spot protein 1 (RHS1), putative [Trypanosoma brucei brucei TREU927]